MINLDDAFNVLSIDIQKLAQIQKERSDLLNSPLPAGLKDEREQELKQDLERQRTRVLKLLTEVIEFPPHHLRHAQQLGLFHAGAGFDRSVFVMTKFPDPKKAAPVDAQLTRILEAVRNTVQDCGYVARLASDKDYHGMLWDNVELYLLGCRRGIAIVEDKYLPELNPNVAMEWGWMRGMGATSFISWKKISRSSARIGMV